MIQIVKENKIFCVYYNKGKILNIQRTTGRKVLITKYSGMFV